KVPLYYERIEHLLCCCSGCCFFCWYGYLYRFFPRVRGGRGVTHNVCHLHAARKAIGREKDRDREREKEREGEVARTRQLLCSDSRVKNARSFLIGQLFGKEISDWWKIPFTTHLGPHS
ncbi:unnamed protein product, partial [Laminaria digitata]